MQELKDYYYQDGNTVRIEEVEYRPKKALPNRRLREQELREDAIVRQKITDRRKAAVLRKNRMLTAYMITAIVLTCAMFVGYVSLQNSVTTRMNNIASLENELSELNASNSAAESRISTSTNLEDVKKRAISDLGMVYATSSQIVYYNMDSSDYMSQYYDIP